MTGPTVLTDARRLILESAQGPAGVVSATGNRVGFERVSWKRNCAWLCEHGFLRANAHGDFYITDAGRAAVPLPDPPEQVKK